MNDCEEVFESFNMTLATPLVLTQPLPWEILYAYLVVVEAEVITILIRECDVNQSHMYFILKALKEAKTR